MVWVLAMNWLFVFAFPFAYLECVRGSSWRSPRGAIHLYVLGVLLIASVGLSAILLAIYLLNEWLNPRRIRVTDRGICAKPTMAWPGFTRYESIERVEFGRVFVGDTAFPILRVVTRKGKRGTIGLATEVPVDQLAGHLSEKCGVTVVWCPDQQ